MRVTSTEAVLRASASVGNRIATVYSTQYSVEEAVLGAEPIEAKLRAAQKQGQLPQRTAAGRRDAAVKQGLITLAEFEHLVRTDRLRREVIMVDDFPTDLSRHPNLENAPWPRAASM